MAVGRIVELKLKPFETFVTGNPLKGSQISSNFCIEAVGGKVVGIPTVLESEAARNRGATVTFNVHVGGGADGKTTSWVATNVIFPGRN